MLTPYEFMDDSCLTDAELLEGFEALPQGVPIRFVPNDLMLNRLHGNMPLSEAFTAWARVTLAVFEAPEDLDLDDAVSAIREEFGTDKSTVTAWVERRALFEPLIAEGWTFRQIAERCALPLLTVARCTWNASTHKAEGLADCEDHLVEFGCPTAGVNAFAACYGLDVHAIKNLCERHGIAYAVAPGQFTCRYSDEMVNSYLALTCRGLPPKRAVSALMVQFPEFDWPSDYRAVRRVMWNRARQRREGVAA